MQAAARELKQAGGVPFAAYCTDPCDGRTQGTAGMFDSLPYRNDAAIVFRRLIRSLPTRRGVLGVATCDKGLPAMMMALAGDGRLALRAGARRRDAAAGAGARTPARCNRSGPAMRTAKSRWKRRPSWAAGPALRRAAAASFWAPPPRRRSSAKRSA